MTPDIVVDIGNSRMKWGRCDQGQIVDAVSLSGDSISAWDIQAQRWSIDSKTCWVVASVNPAVANRFHFWLKDKHAEISVIESYQKIPIEVTVEEPHTVGLDRLLACVGARQKNGNTGPYLVVQAGTAVVINAVDAQARFLGGAIFPGLQLMSESLNQRTAALPVVEFDSMDTLRIGQSTVKALQHGILGSIVGGIQHLIQIYLAQLGNERAAVFLTGGDMDIISANTSHPMVPIPNLVLNGILMTARTWS